MKIEAWPFLIGRNRNLGYQTIVSPPFLSERGLSMLLAETAGGDESGPDDGTYREIHGSEVGDLSLIFRVVRAKARDYDLGEDETLKDRGGRSIRLIEGFVMRGRQKSLRVTHADLHMAHNLVKEAYRKFWDADTTFQEITSSSIGLPTASPSRDVHVEDYTTQDENVVSRREQVQLLREKPLKLPSPLPRFSKVMLAAILLIVLIISSPTGIAVYRILNPPPSIDPILSTFCNDLQKAKATSYSNAYLQLSNGIQPSLTRSSFVAFFTKHPVASCTYRKNSISDNWPFSANSATATLMIKYRDRVSISPLTITLQEEQHSWKITTNIITKLQQQKT